MLKLRSGGLEFLNVPTDRGRFVVRLTTNPLRPAPLKAREAFLVNSGVAPDGFSLYVYLRNSGFVGTPPEGASAVVLPDDYQYLGDGDVLGFDQRDGTIRVLYRRNSPHNSFLVTERCNSYCLMCSQPPRDVQDSWIVDEISEAIPLIDPATREIGFTGGEPTLLGDRFIDLLRLAKNYLPNTAVHVLSNGRNFSDASLAKKVASVEHPDLMMGIPLYSDLSTVHDYVVQADGAYDETIRGILNLKRHRQKVEIRVVVHKQTYERLPQLADFIARNLIFVDHVALMGLEMMGFTKANLPDLWIDPFDYQRELYRAATTLADHHLHVSIYNHQLCVLDRRLWTFARRSISDWKNEHMPECAGCAERENCGGFFSSAKVRYSSHIRPFVSAAAN